MTAMAANSSTGHNVRTSRSGNMSSSSVTGDMSRGNHASMSKGFGAPSGWSSSNIWGGGFDDQQSPDTKTGSSSLLPSSDSDGWNKRPNFPWNTLSTSSAVLTGRQSGGMTVSPVQTRPTDRNAGAISEGSDASSYFPMAPRSQGMTPSTGGPHNSYMNRGPEGISPSEKGIFSGFRNGEAGHRVSTSAFGGSPVGTGFPTKSGFPSPLENPRPDEITGSMGISSISQPDGLPQQLNRTAYAHSTHNSASFATRGTSHSPYPSYSSDNQFEGRYGSGSVDLSANLSKLALNDGSFPSQPSAVGRSAYLSQSSFDGSLQRLRYQNANPDVAYQTVTGYGNEVVPSDMSLGYPTGRSRVADGGPISPTDYNRVGSPSLYSGMGNTLPGPHYRNASGSQLSDGHVAVMDRRMRGSQSELDFVQPSAEAFHRLPFNQSYELAANYQAARLSALSGLYGPIQLNAAALSSRGHREHDSSQVVRSHTLEDFRQNNKGTRKWELRDIYGHVVEFSGDQHGSRFIQQKLETANSDEKERVFQEIQPNSIQLMTDVFGNYVVQKLFEHGNQAQKKILANQMKGHIITLSTQMYGCRVVQKALEHILTDQQASMVKELESHVSRCVKDQNGNHVIQKAIERVPSKHVQFIINEFLGKVERYATHPYGCRVIQRMLEHCREVDREALLSELHACTTRLISDQFGNYVIQHVIENGAEKDRSAMISVVMSNLLAHSKHKFASNVVEKSIEHGDESQRRSIIQMLTCGGPPGDDNNLLGLMRDQYGNYVIQKVLGQLKGAEREALVEQIKPLLGQLKKTTYGKQIAAIEKLIGESSSSSSVPLPGQTDSSSTPPNSHKSSPQPSKRSVNGLENCRVPVVGAAPPTPPPIDNQMPDRTTEPKSIAKTTVTPLTES